MQKTLIFAALWLTAGCAGTPEIYMPRAADFSGYKRFGVLPFSDSRGFGNQYASRVAKGIFALNRDIVPPEHIAHAFRQLRLPEGEPIGLHSLLALQNLTQADAFVFGSVDCKALGRRQVSVLVLSARGGDPLFRASFRHRKCGTRAGVEAISIKILKSLEKAFANRGLRGEVEEGRF